MTALEPLFPSPPGVPLFSTQKAAELIAGPAGTVAECSRRIRTWAQECFIHVRDKRGEGHTAWNLFGLADVVAAGVLAAVTDAGVRDREALQAMSLALYSEQHRVPSFETEFAHPIEEAILAVVRNHFRGVQLFALRNIQTGKPSFVAQIHAPELPSYEPGPTEIVRATLLVPLPAMVVSVIARTKAAATDA